MNRPPVQVTVGVDIVEVSRLRRLLEENSGAEADIFTDLELSYCAKKKQRYAHLAARFAAKEAVLKALGTGLGPGMRWTDVEIHVDPLGCPHVRLRGKVGASANARGGAAEISLSHTGAFALAQASILFTAAAAVA